MKKNILLFCVIIGLFISCSTDSPEPPIDPVAQQYDQDLQEIDAYLAAEGIVAEIDDLYGVRYVIENAGTGLQPVLPDSLTVSYNVSLLSSGESVLEAESEKVRSSSLLDGVFISSTLIQEGGRIKAYIPSVYAYGTTGNNIVPSNSVIIVELDLITLHDQQLREDIEIIDQGLEIRDTVGLVHPTGIRYFINKAISGSGDTPTISSTVTINYEGRLFSAVGMGVTFDSGTNISFELQRLIQGWQIMVPEMSVGDKITMILPSSFAYGERGNTGIAPNSILEFDVTLVDFF